MSEVLTGSKEKRESAYEFREFTEDVFLKPIPVDVSG